MTIADTISEYEKMYGSVCFGDKVFIIVRNPYPVQIDNKVVYESIAFDVRSINNGVADCYLVHWEIVSEEHTWDGDESDVCDWIHPYDVHKMQLDFYIVENYCG